MTTEPQDLSTRRWIASEIRAELGRQNMTQAQLGRSLGLSSRQSMSMRMRGETVFSVPELLKIAEILRVPVTQFLPADSLPAERVA